MRGVCSFIILGFAVTLASGIVNAFPRSESVDDLLLRAQGAGTLMKRADMCKVDPATYRERMQKFASRLSVSAERLHVSNETLVYALKVGGQNALNMGAPRKSDCADVKDMLQQLDQYERD